MKKLSLILAVAALSLTFLVAGEATAQAFGGAGGGGGNGFRGNGPGNRPTGAVGGAVQGGAFTPSGGAKDVGPSNPSGGVVSGPGGDGAAGGANGPGGTGGTGGTGVPGGNGGGGAGLSPPVPGFGPGAAPAGSRGRRTPGPLGIGAPDDAWQNWWRLNEDYYLDIERRYRERTATVDQSLDIFAGTSGVDASPAEGGSKRVRAKILPLLIRGLADEHFSVRAEAALALGKVGIDEDVARLAPLTKDDNLAVRKAAIMGLGLLRSPKALPFLHHILRDSSARNVERGYAALALGVIGDRKAGPWLTKLLNTGRRVRDVDASALYALGLIGDPRSRSYLEYFVSGATNDDFLRAVAVQGLAITRDPESVNVLLRALGDRDVRVRRSAAIGLGAVSLKSRLREQLEDLEKQYLAGDGFARTEDEFENHIGRLRVRAEAEERKLGLVRERVVEAIAERAFHDSDNMVQNFASLSLGQIGGDAAVQHLLAALKEAKLDSRRSFTVLALAISGDDEVAEELSRTLVRGRVDADTRAAIILALGLLDERRASATVLRQLRSRGDTNVASFAGISLGLLEEDKAAPFLKKVVLGKSRPELKRPFGLGLALMGETEFIQALGDQLKKRGPVITKVEVAAALSAIKDIQSLDALVEASTKSGMKDRVFAAIIRAAGIIGERGSLPVLAPMFRHLDYTVRATYINEVSLL